MDGISAKILKETVEQISTPLAHVFNMSLHEGIVHLEWKEANIILLFKKGSRNKSVNYRPLSLTSVICKLLETIIRDHNFMMDFLIKHKLKRDDDETISCMGYDDGIKGIWKEKTRKKTTQKRVGQR